MKTFETLLVVIWSISMGLAAILFNLWTLGSALILTLVVFAYNLKYHSPYFRKRDLTVREDYLVSRVATLRAVLRRIAQTGEGPGALIAQEALEEDDD